VRTVVRRTTGWWRRRIEVLKAIIIIIIKIKKVGARRTRGRRRRASEFVSESWTPMYYVFRWCEEEQSRTLQRHGREGDCVCEVVEMPRGRDARQREETSALG